MKGLLVVVGLMIASAGPAPGQVDVRGRELNVQLAKGQRSWLGMGLSCDRCSYQRVTGSVGRWSFSEPPTVFSVDPNGPADKAGIRTGDTLISINGYVLTSRQGGERFGSARPGDTLTLLYRRGGRNAQAQLIVGAQPIPKELALADSLQSVERLQAFQTRQAERWLASSQRAVEQQRRATQHVIEQMERVQAQLRDSVRSEQVRRLRQVLDSALQQYRSAESIYARTPRPMPVPSLAPAMAAPGAAPAIAAAPTSPLPAMAPAATLAPMSYAEHREFGPLRYSGRVGGAVIEARSPYAVTTTEISDSEVVVTSRDLSVRIALRPRTAPMARPAPAPKAAPAPQPARPARPPED